MLGKNYVTCYKNRTQNAELFGKQLDLNSTPLKKITAGSAKNHPFIENEHSANHPPFWVQNDTLKKGVAVLVIP